VKRLAATLSVIAVAVLFGWLLPAAATAASSTAASTRPLTPTWSVTSLRGTHTSINIPLAPGATCTPTTGVLPTGLVNGRHAATVRVGACSAPNAAGIVTAKLQVQGLNSIGTYTGAIALTAGAPATDAITLSIRRTDILVFPVLAILAGIALAIAAGRLTGRGNPISMAEQQTWQLDAQLPKVANTFAARSTERPWADLSFEPSAKQTLGAAREQLATLRRGFTALDKADPTLKAVTDELSVVSTAIDRWDALPAQLDELAQANDELRNLAPSFHPPGAVPAPVLMSVATSLLSGGPIAVSSVAKRCADVKATAAAARAMAHDARAFISLRTRADAILVSIGNDPAQTERRNYAMWALRGIETDLRAMWSATSAESYLGLPLQNDLNTIAGTLDSLDPPPQPAFAPDFAPPPPAPAPASRTTLPASSTASATSRAARIGRLRVIDNIGLLVVLAVVSLWSGLVALYFGRAWGSVIDYGTAVVWGFGAQGALQSLAAGLDVLVRRVSPPPPSA
jgi:hypothetical protein